MTENEAQKWLERFEWDDSEETSEALATICEALQEYPKFKTIGTIEDFKALKEKSASVEECLNTLVIHCKLRKKNQASCLGCPVRKSYGTKQPEVCKLNMVERPSDLELNIDWSE